MFLLHRVIFEEPRDTFIGDATILEHLCDIVRVVPGLMHPEATDLALIENPLQASRVIGIGVRGNDEIDSVSLIVLPQMLDYLLPCIRKPAIDHNDELLVAFAENISEA